MEADRELRKNQLYWMGVMRSMFSCTLGLLAGSSVLHACVLINLVLFIDDDEWLNLYPQFSAQICIIFLILGNLCVILALTIALIDHKPAQEKTAMIDSERAEYTAAYTRSIVLSVILAFAYAGLLYV